MNQRFTLDKENILKWLKNTLIFAAPFLVVFLEAIKSGVDIKDALYILYLYGINVMIDLLKKFIAGTPTK